MFSAIFRSMFRPMLSSIVSSKLISKRAFFLLAITLAAAKAAHSQQTDFHLQEATIDDVHRTIRDGRITCKGLIQLYINRAKAYNGVSNELVTKDGAPIPPRARRGSRWLAAEISHPDNFHLQPAAQFRSVRRTPDRVRPNGIHRL
jgi:hypothetical protein